MATDLIAPTVESCRALGHKRRMISGSPVPCWNCTDRYRRATCSHSGGRRADWAGILGYRYYCSACGQHVPAPEETQQ